MSIDTATGKEAPADISSERVKDIFSTIAKKYERFNAVSSFGAYKTWLAGMMRQAPIDENADVLDIAGGTGDVTFTVARAKHPRHIQCTDLVDEMLDVAACTMRTARPRAYRLTSRWWMHSISPMPTSRTTHHHGVRHPQHARARPGAFRNVPRAQARRSAGVPGVLNAAERVWRALYGFYLKHLIPSGPA